MGFSYNSGGGTLAHAHTNVASDGGQLNIAATQITGFTPISLVLALGG